MNFLWLLIAHFLLSSPAFAFNDNDKCLDIPEVTPKKYFHLNTQSLPIRLETSSRITHQLSTQVFYIFLKEVLGYARIEINLKEDDFHIDSMVTRLSDYYNPEIIEPPATINLEVWMGPDYDLATELVKEAGSLAPPGRFGWFIPAELNEPIRQYYNKYNVWTESIHEIHWSFFIDRKLVLGFDIDDNTMANLIERNRYNKVSAGSSEYFCNNATICSHSMYTPKQCQNQNCATLLAPHFDATEFLIDHINELNLFVKVLWVGDNLKKVVDELTAIYGMKRSSKSVLFFYWCPSDIIIDENNFIGVTFKNNELFNFTHSEKVGYKYEMHRLVKLAWGKIEKNAQPLFDGLRSFKLTSGDVFFLLNQRELYPAKSLREVACDWMRLNQNTWRWWKKETQTIIYIGGIFPMFASSYNGRGIARAAYMAQTAINKNASILTNYRLQLLITDGKCRADSVMKSFIDFIVEGYYPQLVGVLGPACSETVEPLAGVSKHYHIMVISYSAEGASFSDRKKYPYFFRTIGENQHYKNVYLYLFKYFGWKRVAALTEDGQKYTEYIASMQDDLEKNNINFIANKKFPRERETEAMTRYLQDLKTKRARIIIADVVDDVARAVMCEAYKLDMTAAQGYVWFLPMWLNSTWYHTDYFNRNKTEIVNCTTEEMIKAITGYFAMTHAYFAPDNATMQENITVKQWREQYDKGPIKSDYAGFAYDAVWTYALALDKLAKIDSEAIANLHSENSTNNLVRLVEETDFNGVSGRIKFRGGPSRFSVINIMQWYDKSMHTIGHFYPKLTDNKPEIFGGNLQINASAVKWFTPDRKIPEDGALPPPVCAVEGLARAFDVECQTAMIILNVIVALVLVLIVIFACFYMKKKYEQKVELTAKYMRALGLPFNLNTKDLDKWEISRESVVINRKLGEGAFGTVYGGEANLPDSGWSAVAVKTLKVGSTTEEKLDFLSEAEVMKRFDHKNIVKLLGVCTKDEPVYTVMEFMLYGDLKTFLLARRHLVRKNADDNDEVSAKRLTSMALDVARALSYLTNMKYVHRDVASRNCLVNAQRCVKLGDFGMTRAMFDNDYYKFTRKGMLPVRWMSPESLQLGVFKPSSDVWSFGVLLYEIVTFGSFPYQGKSNAEVLELVKNGHTLDIPKGIKPNLEGLMKSCWNRDSEGRPKASEIVAFLATNPRLLAPCLDVPLASVQPEDNEQLDLTAIKITEIKIPVQESPPTKSSPSESLELPPEYRQFEPKTPEEFESIPMEEGSPKRPLLSPGSAPEEVEEYHDEDEKTPLRGVEDTKK